MLVGPETVGEFRGDAGFVVEALDGAHGEGVSRAIPVEQVFAMSAQRV
jgi:hypothetical protein